MRKMQWIAHPLSLQRPAGVTTSVILESPALCVMVSADPWSLVVLDNSGMPVLQESPGGELDGPIGLGFQGLAAFVASASMWELGGNSVGTGR
jgi:hypothetical protein